MKIRKLQLIEDSGLKYSDLLDVALQGASSSEDVVRIVRLTVDIENAVGKNDGAENAPELILDDESYRFLIARLDKTNWNSPADKRARVALGKFITTLKELKELDAKVTA
jgi:hypothetical protein